MNFNDIILEDGVTQTQLISKQIAEKSPYGKEQEEFLSTVINEFNGSEKRQYMDIAKRYYRNKNDILEAKREVIGKDSNNQPILVDSKVLSNNTLTHNFMKKLTRQKIGYLMGKLFTISPAKTEDTLTEDFIKEMKYYFGKDFHKKLKNIGRDSIVNGIGWAMVYYDEKGDLQVKRCEPEEVIPFWSDSDHTVLDAVVRVWTVETYQGGIKTVLKNVDYYTLEGVYHYQYNSNGKLVPAATDFLTPYFKIRETDAKTGEVQEIDVNWAKIPFIPFKYDPDEQSLLTRIKELIDDYDKKTSGVANNIDDFPNSITVVKNYDGVSREEFVANKNQYRTMFVQGDGDAKTLETPLNVSDVDIHIERLRQDIYEFGQGVDTANKDIRDTSGVALRFLYADLDMDCIDWGSELEWSIMSLIWFCQQDIKARTGKDFTQCEYDIIFSKDVIINETENIQNCFVSNGIISNRTIAENHPWVKNADKEVNELLEETGDKLDLEAEYAKAANKGAGGK